MRVLPCGDRALLVDLAAGDGAGGGPGGGAAPDPAAALAAVLALDAALAADPVPGVAEVVPAAATLLLRLRRGAEPRAVARAVAARAAAARAGGDRAPVPAQDEVVELPVVYDGADLAEVGRLTGLGADGVVAAHTAAAWTVAFCGFAPGFGYLVGDDPRLHVPRRDSPRTRVPAGSVGLAGPFTGVYPSASPGGWQLLGRTPVSVLDLEREPPALLRPGVKVRFRAVPAAADPAADPGADAADGPARSARDDRPGTPDHPPARGLLVVSPGPGATVQDLGRPGLARLGVGRSGAADRGALRLANRLVGNAEDAAGLEATYGGLVVRAVGHLLVAVAGAPCEVGGVGGRGGMHVPLALADGEELRLGPPASGLRTYLAVRGGLAVAPVLGARATDVLAGLGPPRPAAGSLLAVGGAAAGDPGTLQVPRADPPGGTVVVRVVPGPRDDWFADGALDRLASATWTVGAASDRVGMRLDGPALPRRRSGELPSEGVVAGCLQVPPEGRPVVLGPDHPVTGGYPVVAVVVSTDLDALAQLRPGQGLRLVPVRGGALGPGAPALRSSSG